METNEFIYLDNAATSFPKPPEVLTGMNEKYARYGVSPGRGSYDLAVYAAELVWQTREKLARFFNAPDPNRVIFTANATDALNLAIQGLLQPGDHVVSTQLEHNSVLRPLYHLRERDGIAYDLVPFDEHGLVSPDDIVKAFKPKTKLVVISHASNVLGTVQPIKEIGCLCAEHGIPLLLDVAQSAGHIPINMLEWQVSAIAFTGHKALMGPAGIGGLIISPDLELQTTRFGGTGVDSLNLRHTQSYPHRLEAGTLNMPGIFGLSAALDYLEQNKTKMQQQKTQLTKLLYEGLREIKGIRLLSPEPKAESVPVLTCTVKDRDASVIGEILDGDYQIAVRTGLHCAPLVHKALRTAETGAVRFSPGPFNTQAQIKLAIRAMAEIAAML
ncbi:MAG: aminotransferase class V-fold PLP-dependent enzyme [Firmicutes bacterium]|nr:aminotransferase class V-fold PLP-dependent enzyme [Bacillota bacterium]